ncbi:MAG TPA: DUF6049 family protein [Blastococcus sp.]
MRATALLRAAVAPLVAAALSTTALGLLPAPALAAPAMPVLAAAPAAGDSSEPDRPVQIEVARFEPRAVTPGAAVTVTGTLTNTGPVPISDLSVRLQRGAVLTTRADLAADGSDPDPATAVEPAFQPLPGELPAGGELHFSYTVPSEELHLDRDGVYPALLNVNGALPGDQRQRVGQLSTYLVQQPAVPVARTAVAWLWPLVERTHRGPSGAFLDDGLADAVGSEGRLDRALSVIERLPSTLLPDAKAPVPVVQVALAIDPALVEELTIMAAGPYDVAGQDDAGRGTAAAAAFLERLTAVAAVHPVIALPYGDVDADALHSAGLDAVLARSLPGTPAGTAEDAVGSPTGDVAGATPSAGGGPAAPEEEAGIGAGAELLAAALDAEPRTDLAWAPGGSPGEGALTALRAGGVDLVVLDADGLSEGNAAVGLAGNRATAHVTVPTAGGPLDALVADPTLGEVVGSAEQTSGGARLAEQRYLADLALLSMQARPGTEPTVLVAAPRDVDAGLEGAGAMIADTAAFPWLRPATVAELAAGPSAEAGVLVRSADTATLDPAGLADVTAAAGVREDLAGAVVGDADSALSPFDAAISRATSTAWRGDPAGFRDSAGALRSALDRLRGQVTLLAPADGTYSLGSTEAPLVLTVRNDLPIAVQVRLEVAARGSRGLSISDIGLQTLAPGERTTLQVPTEVRQSGGFAVNAQLTTPDGAPLGDRIQLQVKSTAYGSISLLITFGAAGLLTLLFLRRLVHFVLRRRATAVADGAGAPEGAAVPLPPNRSPV